MSKAEDGGYEASDDRFEELESEQSTTAQLIDAHREEIGRLDEEIDRELLADGGVTAAAPSASERSMGRRAFIVGGAATVGSVALGSAVADDGDEDQGEQVEVGSAYNWGSPFAHESELRAEYEIAEVKLDDDYTDLSYEGDDGEDTTLAADGWELVPRDRDHEEDDPIVNNPVKLRLDLVDHERMYSAPRDVFEEDEDGDDEDSPISFLKADEWDGDDILSGDSYDDELVIDGLGSVSFTHEDFEIDSSELSRMISLIVNVEELGDDDDVTITIDHNGEDDVELVIDNEADEDDDDAIAVSEADGILHQVHVGDLADDVEDIDGVTIDTSGDPTVEIHGFDIEASTKWEFGEREIIDEAEDDDEDDELDEETVDEWDGGYVDITSLDTIEGAFSTARIEDVRFDVRQRARDLPREQRYVRTVESPVGFDREWRSTPVFEHEVTSGFNLEVRDVDTLKVHGGLPDSRYDMAGYDVRTDTFDEDEEVEDILDDLEDSIVSLVGDLDDNVGEDEPIEEGLSDVGESDVVTFVADYELTDDELTDLEDHHAFAVAAREDEGWLTGPRAFILGVAALVGGWLANVRGRIPG